MSAEKKLAELGITLPPPPQPVGAYVPTVRTGNLLFISAVLPLENGKITLTGKVGAGGLSIEDGQRAARNCVLNSLAAARAALGSLDQIKRIVRLNGYVQSAEGFSDQPKVLNGASELLVQFFGDDGKHTRSAVGAYALPMNAPVIIDFIMEVK